MEKMLSPLEWFNLFSETCKGLLKLATPSSHYKLTYFIYCAVVTTRFTGSLEKVSPWSVTMGACMSSWVCDAGMYVVVVYAMVGYVVVE